MTTNWRALKSWDVLNLQPWRQPTCTAIPLRRMSNIRPRYDGQWWMNDKQEAEKERTNKTKTKQILKSLWLSLSLSLSVICVCLCVSAGFGSVAVPYTAGLGPHTQKLEGLKFSLGHLLMCCHVHIFFFLYFQNLKKKMNTAKLKTKHARTQQ